MGLDQYAHLRNKQINWDKYYSDNEEERKEKQSTFSFGQARRLQTFFARKWRQQNEAEQEEG